LGGAQEGAGIAGKDERGKKHGAAGGAGSRVAGDKGGAADKCAAALCCCTALLAAAAPLCTSLLFAASGYFCAAGTAAFTNAAPRDASLLAHVSQVKRAEQQARSQLEQLRAQGNEAVERCAGHTT